MTVNPCDTCREECVGGIIYGNCQKFLNWWRDRYWCIDSHHSDIFHKPQNPVKTGMSRPL